MNDTVSGRRSYLHLTIIGDIDILSSFNHTWGHSETKSSRQSCHYPKRLV